MGDFAGERRRIRRAYEVWNESGPAAVTDQFWAEDAVYREGPGWPNAGVHRGRATALARMQSLIDLAGPIEVRLDDLIEAGDGRFVACTRMVGQGASAPYTRSFAGFIVPEGGKRRKGKITEITEIDLAEISAVSTPANAGARTLSIKSHRPVQVASFPA